MLRRVSASEVNRTPDRWMLTVTSVLAHLYWTNKQTNTAIDRLTLIRKSERWTPLILRLLQCVTLASSVYPWHSQPRIPLTIFSTLQADVSQNFACVPRVCLILATSSVRRTCLRFTVTRSVPAAVLLPFVLFRVKRLSVLFTSMSVFCVLSLKYDYRYTFHTHGLLLKERRKDIVRLATVYRRLYATHRSIVKVKPRKTTS